MRKLTISTLLVITALLCSSWGFYAHKKINQLAVFTLPSAMMGFYKRNIRYVTEHAPNPDMRRYVDTAEAPRHYLDVENYEKDIDSIPKKYKDAVVKYGEKHLHQNGIVPWQIQRTYFNLVSAFKQRDSLKILRYSADLGHYVADANVPLHTSANHNGQLTNQVGIHAFWESRVPELFAENYNFLVGKALYIEDPLAHAWKIVKKSHALVDSVLTVEANLSRTFPADGKYDFSQKGKIVVKQYAVAYTKAYQALLNGMVERQMRKSITDVGSYWYSAWVDAGQPSLKNLIKIEPTPEEKLAAEKERQKISEGKLIGREF